MNSDSVAVAASITLTFVDGYVEGIRQCAVSMEEIARGVALADGPLSDIQVDLLRTLANNIRDNIPRIKSSLEAVARAEP